MSLEVSRLAKARIRREVVQLAGMGATIHEIHQIVGVSTAKVRRILTVEIQHLGQLRIQDAARLREIEIARYEDLIAASWDAAVAEEHVHSFDKLGQPNTVKGPSVPHAQLVLSVMAQMSKALGTNAPEKREITATTTTTVQGSIDLAAVPTPMLVQAQERLRARILELAAEPVTIEAKVASDDE